MPMSKRDDRKRHKIAGQLASLTLANALIFHNELSERVSGVRRPASILSSSDPITDLGAEWLEISTTIDYKPIFDVARQVLSLLPLRVETHDAIRELDNAARRIISNRAALKHDLMGRIYHTLLLDAKFLGTFYTSVPAATLLMKFALNPKSWAVNWSDLTAVADLRVADLACGTGTLLMAAEQALVDNHVRARVREGKPIGAEDLRNIHRALIEEAIYGYDVLSSAIHLTASTLALLSIESSFSKMHLWSMALGVEGIGGDVHLGSIDFLGAMSVQPQMSLMDTTGAWGAARRVADKGDEVSTAPLPMLDLCVMNPPFTRSVGGNLLFGSLPAKQRALMQKRLSALLKEYSKRSRTAVASATAGLASVFISVAHARIKEGGRLALVIPAAVCTGIAWEKTRDLFRQSYVLELLVTSHDPRRWSFSENTELSEVLLVLRKRRSSEKNSAKTTVLNLIRNPKNPIEALAVANQVLNLQRLPEMSNCNDHATGSVFVSNIKYGEATSISWTELRRAPWKAGAFSKTELNKTAYFLDAGKLYIPGKPLFDVPITTFGKIGTVGPDRRDVYDAFNLVTSRTPYSAWWSHDSNRVTAMSAEPNAFLEPLAVARKNRPLRKLSDVWSGASDAMLAERMWMPTQRVTSVLLPVPAVSNVWWPITLNSAGSMERKLLVLWWNSTLGLISLLAARVPTRGPWLQFKKPTVHALPVLNFTKLEPDLLPEDRDVDELLHKEMQPFPDMHSDPVRKQIDALFCQLLRIPDIRVLRDLLSIEPVVTDQTAQ